MSDAGANYSHSSHLNETTAGKSTSTMRPTQSPPSSPTNLVPVPISPTIRSPSHNTAQGMSPGRSQAGPSGLRITALPKYHPAFYRSPNSTNTNTPSTSRPVSRGLLSPRSYARQVSDGQRQHQEYQRQMLATLRQATGVIGPPPPSDTPRAPQIVPHDSPGPATPLNLEEPSDYLTARRIGEGSPREFTERLIREEQDRRAGMRVDRTSPAISPRC
jgi:hypothetical protein